MQTNIKGLSVAMKKAEPFLFYLDWQKIQLVFKKNNILRFFTLVLHKCMFHLFTDNLYKRVKQPIGKGES
jgi:hypothetical protein